MVDLVLAVGLLQLRRGARTWVLIRAAVGGLLLPIFWFFNNDLVRALLMGVPHWAASGSLILLLTGTSKIWRLVASVGIFIVLALGPYASMLFLVALSALTAT